MYVIKLKMVAKISLHVYVLTVLWRRVLAMKKIILTSLALFSLHTMNVITFMSLFSAASKWVNRILLNFIGGKACMRSNDSKVKVKQCPELPPLLTWSRKCVSKCMCTFVEVLGKCKIIILKQFGMLKCRMVWEESLFIQMFKSYFFKNKEAIVILIIFGNDLVHIEPCRQSQLYRNFQKKCLRFLCSLLVLVWCFTSCM